MIIDKHPENETPQKFFVITSVFNVLTMTTSNMALQYVPYVALVVGKGVYFFKMIILFPDNFLFPNSM